MADEKIQVVALKSFASARGGLSMRRNQRLPISEAAYENYGPEGAGFVRKCTSDENLEEQIAELEASHSQAIDSLQQTHAAELADRDAQHAAAVDDLNETHAAEIKKLQLEMKEVREAANKQTGKAEKLMAKAEAAAKKASRAPQGDLLKDEKSSEGDGAADAKTETGDGGEGDGAADAKAETGEGGEGEGKTEAKPADPKSKPADKKPPAKSEAGLG